MSSSAPTNANADDAEEIVINMDNSDDDEEGAPTTAERGRGDGEGPSHLVMTMAQTLSSGPDSSNSNSISNSNSSNHPAVAVAVSPVGPNHSTEPDVVQISAPNKEKERSSGTAAVTPVPVDSVTISVVDPRGRNVDGGGGVAAAAAVHFGDLDEIEIELSADDDDEADEADEPSDHAVEQSSERSGGAGGALIDMISRASMREFLTEITPVERSQIMQETIPRRTRRRTVNKQGEVIYKGHESFGLQCMVQLAIRIAVGYITPRPARDLRTEDFKVSTKLNFPRTGSDRTPPHEGMDFQFKDYCPMVFRQVRERFGIDAADYMVSLCGAHSLSKVGGAGKSGALFYYSHDCEYIIKTVTKRECKFFMTILRHYYNHMMNNPNTLITRFYGLHRIKPSHGRNVRFIVMNNVFITDKKMHEIYDLKGSTVGRLASDKERRKQMPVLKDLDLNKHLYFGKERKRQFLQQIRLDTKFLADMKIMDYSLLLGIHHRMEDDSDFQTRPLSARQRALIDRGPTEIHVSSGATSTATSSASSSVSSSTTTSLSLPTSVQVTTSFDSTRIQSNKSRAGISKPATGGNASQFKQDEGGMYAIDEIEGEERDELYFVGIIDILQKWNLRKQFERFGKGMVEDRNAISAIPPHKYAQRFEQFIGRIIV